MVKFLKSITLFTKKLLILFLLLALNSCNTLTNTVEGSGVGKGIARDVKSLYHYSTCVFSRVQCGDLKFD
ncbi:hypothetical protein [Candidatus Pelagibacter sp.]|uniref:hypothetical protein n=1 Tax=Candidatus Pelagibacter sp. TaxID=2024849 RepID=UPI003F86CFFE